MAIDNSTIAAVATPPGVSAVAIIRISGPHAVGVAQACFTPVHPGEWTAQRMRRGFILDARSGDRIDDALAVAFFAPNSYTGEDVVELHVHGGAGVVASCLLSALGSGARLATPGEFTRRAFINGRIDLAQAEAVADLIAAESRLAAKAAAVRLEGAVGRALRDVRADLLALLTEIEAHVDYPDEVDAPGADDAARRIRAHRATIERLISGAGAAQALRDGLDCVIAGPPNAGKSSLLNALLDAERAIVSDTPGTTRDIVEDRVAVDGVVLRLRDTAGLRATADPIEAEGVARARKAVEQAELVLLVLDGSHPLEADEREALALTESAARIIICNKQDLGETGARALLLERPELASNGPRHAFVAGSVLQRACIDRVRAEIARLGWGGAAIDANTALVANARQIQAMVRGRDALERAVETIDAANPIDLLSGDLREAIAAFGEVTGETVTEEVLDGIFSRFCVGK